jgi:hypothetical protein
MFMAMIWEKIVVTAKEFLTDVNINDSFLLNDPTYHAKVVHFDWDLSFACSSMVCEIIWKKSVGRESLTEFQRLDRLFSPSPIATHCNFRGCKAYKTGNVPEPGSIAVWKKGNGWGHMAIVVDVADNKEYFTVIEGKVMEGSDKQFLTLEQKEKKTTLPFRSDKLNLIGFIYPPNREIN